MNDGVRALERGLSILFLFEENPSLGVSDIARRLDLNKATVWRLLGTLVNQGLVVQDPITSEYQLSFRLLRLVNGQLQNPDLRGKARPHMEHLRDLTGETVALWMRVGVERVCLEQVESRHEVRHTMAVGTQRSVVSGSTGQILIAFLPEVELDRLLASFASCPIDDLASFKAQLAAVRERGHAMENVLSSVGTSGVSAPVWDHEGRVLAALNVSGPAARWTETAKQANLPSILAEGAALSAQLGYREGPVYVEPRTAQVPYPL